MKILPCILYLRKRQEVYKIKTIPQVFTVILLVLFFSICSQAQTILDRHIETKDIDMIIGGWTVSLEAKNISSKEYSWGIGNYYINNTFVIDKDVMGNFYLINPGVPAFPIISISKIKNNEYMLLVGRPLNRSYIYFPEKGNVKLIFTDVSTLNIEDSYGAFTPEKLLVLFKIAGPNIPYADFNN